VNVVSHVYIKRCVLVTYQFVCVNCCYKIRIIRLTVYVILLASVYIACSVLPLCVEMFISSLIYLALDLSVVFLFIDSVRFF